MILIYSTQTSTRLQYICRFIFEEILGVPFNLTLHAESFSSHEGAKINYSTEAFKDAYQIKPHTLLFEQGIKAQDIICTGEGENMTFFSSDSIDHAFDVFATSFYLISRYEEYLPHDEDMYGRYAHTNSIAHRKGFLNIPLVNHHLNDLRKKLAERFPELQFKPQAFNFLPTYDIDMAWSYKEKGLLRNAAGFLKNPSMERLSALIGFKKDPFDNYRFMNDLHNLYGLRPLYFFLVALQNSVYDKNILPDNEAMKQLIQNHADKYDIGLHPSWKSNSKTGRLSEEKDMLEQIAGKAITSSRQHYIKLNLPQTYQQLTAAGITDDYSMGYGSINGFRASVASSFLWYDLPSEMITGLRIHPFCFMDANCFYEEKLSVSESFNELMHYYKVCKNEGGTIITIFHNNFLGDAKEFEGWKNLYTKFISQLQ